MASEVFADRLSSLSRQINEIEFEYRGMKFTSSEEAMTWPLSITVDEDEEVSIWCNKEGCLLDGHNSQIMSDSYVSDFTLADLMSSVVSHIERNEERKNG